MKKAASFLIVCAFGSVICTGFAEEPLGPGWKSVKGTYATPEQLHQSQQAGGGLTALIEGDPVMAMAAASLPPYNPVELTELSRGLEHGDPRSVQRSRRSSIQDGS